MDRAEQDEIKKRYNQRLDEHGYSPKTLGWDKNRHWLRYHILLSQWDFNGASVLDFGCGFGDMYAYMKEKGVGAQYTGVDINERLIEQGLKIYPDLDLRATDIFETDPGQFDYALSSGVHNLKIKDNKSFIEATFEKFSQISTKGFALNFLSNKVQYELEHIYHVDPAYILDLAYKYSNKVVLRNDYMPFEFTIFVDKQNSFDKTTAVYQDYVGMVK